MRQRILQGAAATLTVTLADQNGSPADAAGALTVSVALADGTSVLPAGTATTHGSTGVYNVALTSAQTSSLNLLTAVWTDVGNSRTVTTMHEIVGGFFFSLADARASNNGLIANTTNYPDQSILDTRYEVEEEAENICDVAFVPRYHRATLDGWASSDIMLPHNRIRTIRSVRIYPVVGGSTYTALTSTQLAALVVDDDGLVHRTDFGFFDEGRGNIVIEYERGWDAPPAQIKAASLIRLRNRLNAKGITGLDEHTSNFTGEDGQTFNLTTAGVWTTGIPEVDAAYERYSYRSRGVAGMKGASMPLNLDPQRYSIFHGGIR